MTKANSILFGFAHKDVQTMATKNATETTKNGKSNEKAGDRMPSFVKYNLSDDERDQAKNAAETLADVGEIVAQLIDEGYKFSASHDNYGGGTQVFITPQKPDSVNAGWTLSARGPSLVLAVGVLAWKHFTLFSRDWPKDADSRAPRNQIG